LLRSVHLERKSPTFPELLFDLCDVVIAKFIRYPLVRRHPRKPLNLSGVIYIDCPHTKPKDHSSAQQFAFGLYRKLCSVLFILSLFLIFG